MVSDINHVGRMMIPLHLYTSIFPACTQPLRLVLFTSCSSADPFPRPSFLSQPEHGATPGKHNSRAPDLGLQTLSYLSRS